MSRPASFLEKEQSKRTRHHAKARQTPAPTACVDTCMMRCACVEGTAWPGAAARRGRSAAHARSSGNRRRGNRMKSGRTGARQDSSAGPGRRDLFGDGPALAECGVALDAVVGCLAAGPECTRRDAAPGTPFKAVRTAALALQVLACMRTPPVFRVSSAHQPIQNIKKRKADPTSRQTQAGIGHSAPTTYTLGGGYVLESYILYI